MARWLAVRVFVAFFLTLFGLHLVLAGNDAQALLGSAISGTGLTFLFAGWVQVRKSAD